MSRCPNAGPGRPAALCHCAAARRLRPRRDRDFDRGTTDQDRRQSAPSGEPRRDRCIRRGGGAVALRPRPLEGAVQRPAEIQSWGAFEAALLRADAEGARAQRRGPAHSHRPRDLADPAQADRRAAQALPQAKWYRYEPVDDDAARAGAMQAFGRPLTALPRFADARVALMLDADPLGAGPEQIRHARDICRGAAVARRQTNFCGSMRRAGAGR